MRPPCLSGDLRAALRVDRGQDQCRDLQAPLPGREELSPVHRPPGHLWVRELCREQVTVGLCPAGLFSHNTDRQVTSLPLGCIRRPTHTLPGCWEIGLQSSPWALSPSSPSPPVPGPAEASEEGVVVGRGEALISSRTLQALLPIGLCPAVRCPEASEAGLEPRLRWGSWPHVEAHPLGGPCGQTEGTGPGGRKPALPHFLAA